MAYRTSGKAGKFLLDLAAVMRRDQNYTLIPFAHCMDSLVIEKPVLEESCKNILAIEKIRFVGVLDKMGNLIAGGFKEGITSYLGDRANQMMYIQLTLEYLMRKDFDAELGSIDYIASRRGKVTMISIPTAEYLILISAERDVDVGETMQKVNSAFASLPDIPL